MKHVPGITLLAAVLLGLPVGGALQEDAPPDNDSPQGETGTADSAATDGTGPPGEQLFLACAGCHALQPEDANLVGPHLAGIVGRQSANLADYAYSPALAEASFAWDRNVLFSWIVAAESLLPGTYMLYHNHLEPDEVFRLIDYLEENGEPLATER